MYYDDNIGIFGSDVFDEFVTVMPQVELCTVSISWIILDRDVVLSRIGSDENKCYVVR